MPTNCVVPNCKSNIRTTAPYVKCFSFPNDASRREKWIKAIPRKDDYQITKYTRICIKHFDDSFIIKNNMLKKLTDGSISEVPRKKWSLTKNALPTIFSSCPKYYSKDLDPEERLKKIQVSLIEAENILNVNDIVLKKDKYDLKNFSLINSMDSICFILVTFTPSPKISVSFKIDKELVVQVFRDDSKVNMSEFKFILGKGSKCNTFTKLNKLISHLSFIPNIKKKEVNQIKHTNHDIIDKLKEIINLQNSENEKTTLSFLLDQFQIINAKRCHYSTHHIVLSIYIYYVFENAYTFLRESDYLMFPHQNYVKTLNIVKLNTDSVHSKYLTNKLTKLQPFEKYVNLLLHDFYIKTANEIDGIACNNIGYNGKSIFQLFMISSIVSTNTDFLGYYSAKNFDIENFNQVIQNILRILHNAGYEVVSIISDNNEHNRKIYEKLSGWTDYSLQPFIMSPFAENKKLFLLFDTADLLKKIRNNWLDDKSQTFCFPNITAGNTNNNLIRKAKVADLKYVQQREENSNIKYATKLLHKTIYPTSAERLDFQLILDIFDNTNIEALKQYENELNSESVDTAEFINIINKWWSIVNVTKAKERFENIEEENELALPIWEFNQQNVLFLKSFVRWLQDWENPEFDVINSSSGKLHNITFKALKHTTNSFLSLIEYTLESLKFQCVLLGKHQLLYHHLK